MKYTPVQFGYALLRKVHEKPFDIIKISGWCNHIYMSYIRELDDSLRDLLFELSTMADDSQFEYSQNQLETIAMNLIQNENGLQNDTPQEFECGDEVMIKNTAPAEYRPCMQGIIYWISPYKRILPIAVEAKESFVYFVKFSDGEIIETPKNFLILLLKQTEL